MEIRELKADEEEAAIALWRAAGLTRPWNDPEADLRRACDRPASELLAGVVGGELIATAMVGHDGHRGWVYYLAVRADQRKRGYGRAMMGAAERWLAARGIPKLNLMVRGENAATRAFYAALGYELDDVVVLLRRLE